MQSYGHFTAEKELFTLRDSADPVNTDRPIRLTHPACQRKRFAPGAKDAKVRVPGIVFGCFAERVSKANKENNYLNSSERNECMRISSKRHTNMKNEARRHLK